MQFWLSSRDPALSSSRGSHCAHGLQRRKLAAIRSITLCHTSAPIMKLTIHSIVPNWQRCSSITNGQRNLQRPSSKTTSFHILELTKRSWTQTSRSRPVRSSTIMSTRSLTRILVLRRRTTLFLTLEKTMRSGRLRSTWPNRKPSTESGITQLLIPMIPSRGTIQFPTLASIRISETLCPT